jgi:hypothetical protein
MHVHELAVAILCWYNMSLCAFILPIPCLPTVLFHLQAFVCSSRLIAWESWIWEDLSELPFCMLFLNNFGGIFPFFQQASGHPTSITVRLSCQPVQCCSSVLQMLCRLFGFLFFHVYYLFFWHFCFQYTCILYLLFSLKILIIHRLFATLQISLKGKLYKIVRKSSLYLTEQVIK